MKTRMWLRHTAMCASLLLLAQACTPAARSDGTMRDTSTSALGTPAADTSAVRTSADTALVASMERGPCRGFCPAYRVSVFADGRVTFEGERNVHSTGPQAKTVSTDAVRRLMAAIASSGFASADTAYLQDSAGCGRYHTDMPVTVLTARLGAHIKTIRHDPGCQDAPGFLQPLEAQVDSAAGTSLWITGKGEYGQ